MMIRALALFAALAVACGGADEPPCDSCRGDEMCVDDACVAWVDAPLWVDFDIVYDPEQPRRVECVVAEGGFPRAFVDSLRFDFGDHIAGYGERIGHEYAAPGVYPVELEVRLDGYRVLRAAKVAVIAEADGTDPAPRVRFTLDQIPDQLNGSIPYDSDNGTPNEPGDDYTEPFNLLVPRTGFSVDVTVLDSTDASIEPDSIELIADVDLGGGAAPAGTDLSDLLVFEPAAAGAPAGHWIVGEDHAFPDGRATLTLRATDTDGAEHVHAIAFDVVELTPARDPFDRPMVWLFRFDQDLFTTSPGTEGRAIDSAAGADGAPDFVQELALIGAQGSDAALNARYLDWIVDAIIAETYRYYQIGPDGTAHGGIPLTIVASDAPGAPDPADFAVDGDFSIMRFGGVFDGFLGFSGFSWHNEVRVDDSTPGRGVATSNILDAIVTTATLATEFWGIMPGLGAPLGEHARDPEVLAADFDRYDPDADPAAVARYDELARVARLIAIGVGAVAAHEMGHAMGLVPDGAPPIGFFGGRGDVTFMDAERTNSHHAGYPGVNLMQAGGNPLTTLVRALETIELPDGLDLVEVAIIAALENRLSAYALAYFRRQLTYADQ